MIKLVLLKSGEEVITIIEEMIVNEKVVGYFFKHPCAAKLYSDGSPEDKYRIKLTPWMPLSKNEVIPVVSDWIISITDPVDKLQQMYEKGIEKHEAGKSESIDSTESESGNTD